MFHTSTRSNTHSTSDSQPETHTHEWQLPGWADKFDTYDFRVEVPNLDQNFAQKSGLNPKRTIFGAYEIQSSNVTSFLHNT